MGQGIKVGQGNKVGQGKEEVGQVEKVHSEQLILALAQFLK